MLPQFRIHTNADVLAPPQETCRSGNIGIKALSRRADWDLRLLSSDVLRSACQVLVIALVSLFGATDPQKESRETVVDVTKEARGNKIDLYQVRFICFRTQQCSHPQKHVSSVGGDCSEGLGCACRLGAVSGGAHGSGKGVWGQTPSRAIAVAAQPAGEPTKGKCRCCAVSE